MPTDRRLLAVLTLLASVVACGGPDPARPPGRQGTAPDLPAFAELDPTRPRATIQPHRTITVASTCSARDLVLQVNWDVAASRVGGASFPIECGGAPLTRELDLGDAVTELRLSVIANGAVPSWTVRVSGPTTGAVRSPSA